MGGRLGMLGAVSAALLGAEDLREIFAREVPRHLEVPGEEQARYAEILRSYPLADQECVLLVDRHPLVQAALLYAHDGEQFGFVGADLVSTGKPGTFEHFLSPLGAFLHTPVHPDYRAAGTKNKNGIRGYGRKGMRVFDFGWREERQTWGRKAMSQMRLQMHATDPDRLEPKLGTRQSKGCIRISAAMNSFLDRYGVLDAEYDEAKARGEEFWLTMPAREAMPTPYRPGRFLVIVETERSERPEWAKRGPEQKPVPRAAIKSGDSPRSPQ